MRKSKVNTSMISEIGEGKRGESGHIGYLLRQAHAAHRIRMEQVLQDVGVTLPQFSVLLMVAEYPKGADLARLSLLTPQTMSVIVKNLEKAGMISKLPHPEHGRIQIIEITQLGKALLLQCKGAVKSTENRLLSGVSESDEKVIRKWLVNVAKQFDTDKA